MINNIYIKRYNKHNCSNNNTSKDINSKSGKRNRSKNIKPLLEPLIPEAIRIASSNGQSRYFTARSLFYKARRLFLEKYPDREWYKNDSNFTQDFLRSYQEKYGKIQGLVYDNRGRYSYPYTVDDRFTITNEEEIGAFTELKLGNANKIIVVEKEGLYNVMKAEKFGQRLDAIILTTKGYSTEYAREMLIEAEASGLPICILHDFDISGINIHRTLSGPTTRIQIHLKKVPIDLGFTWQDINYLGLKDDAEPVQPPKQHLTLIKNKLEIGELTLEQYEFLLHYRVELDILTPVELLDYLEKKLKKLNLWKTLPKQEEIDSIIKTHLESKIDKKKKDLLYKISSEIPIFNPVNHAISKLISDLSQLQDDSNDNIKEEIIENDINTEFDKINFNLELLKAEDLKKEIEEDDANYWTVVADRCISNLCEHEVRSKTPDFNINLLKNKILEEVEFGDIKDVIAKAEEIFKNWKEDILKKEVV